MSEVPPQPEVVNLMYSLTLLPLCHPMAGLAELANVTRLYCASIFFSASWSIRLFIAVLTSSMRRYPIDALLFVFTPRFMEPDVSTTNITSYLAGFWSFPVATSPVISRVKSYRSVAPATFVTYLLCPISCTLMGSGVGTVVIWTTGRGYSSGSCFTTASPIL